MPFGRDDWRIDGVLQKQRIHLVSDEIYPLLVWEDQADEPERRPVEFESVLMEVSIRLI